MRRLFKKNKMLTTSVLICMSVIVVCAASRSAAVKGNIAHGFYIVHNVSMCTDCHGVKLEGSKLPFKPAAPIKMWNPTAPTLRKLQGYSQADLITIMSTGKRPGGIPFLLPMPKYKMNKTDASAVAAYLKSLK